VSQTRVRLPVWFHPINATEIRRLLVKHFQPEHCFIQNGTQPAMAGSEKMLANITTKWSASDARPPAVIPLKSEAMLPDENPMAVARHWERRNLFRIRVITLAAVLALLWNLPLLATMPPTGSVTLMWNPSPSPDIAGYNVLYGTASGDYTSEVLVGNTNVVTISNLEPGITYYFAVTCYNLAGEESAPSNEATYTVPADLTSQAVVLGNAALASNGFSFTVTDEAGTNFVVEASVDLVNWIPVSTNTAPFTFVDTDASQFSQRFYRTVALP
jgi:hypothetical protein